MSSEKRVWISISIHFHAWHLQVTHSTGIWSAKYEHEYFFFFFALHWRDINKYSAPISTSQWSKVMNEHNSWIHNACDVRHAHIRLSILFRLTLASLTSIKYGLHVFVACYLSSAYTYSRTRHISIIYIATLNFNKFNALFGKYTYIIQIHTHTACRRTQLCTISNVINKFIVLHFIFSSCFRPIPFRSLWCSLRLADGRFSLCIHDLPFFYIYWNLRRSDIARMLRKW